MKIWYLSVSSFADIVPHAYHHYGRIRGKTGGIDGECDPFHREIVLEKSNGTTGFATRCALVRAAMRWFAKNSERGDVLIDGSHTVLDPRKILKGPPDIFDRGNDIWKRFEALDGWDGPKENWDKVQTVCKEWDAIFR